MSKNIFISFCLIISFWPLCAQEREMEYAQKLSISEGLAHNGVTDILEDSRGYFWFGTYDGINRYNGYELETFKNRIGNNILVSNRVRVLKEDSKGNIWIGTDEGISLYDYSSQQFSEVYSNRFSNGTSKGPIVRDILIDEGKGLIICATEREGILTFNEDYTLNKKYLPTNGSDLEFYQSISLGQGYYVYATSEGIFGFDLATGLFQNILEEQIHFSSDIIRTGDSSLLVCLDKGVALIDFKRANRGYSFRKLSEHFETEKFNAAMIDQLGNLWLGTMNDGVILIDNIDTFRKENKFQRIIYKGETGFLRISCFATIKDKEVWAATFNNGLYRFDLSPKPFKIVKDKTGNSFGVNRNHSLLVSALDHDRIYMTLNRGGLVLYNTKTEKYEPLTFPVSVKEQSQISVVFKDSRNYLWLKIGDEGYFRYRADKKFLEPINNKFLGSFNNTSPYKIIEDKEGNIWFGCSDGAYKITVNEKGDITNIEALNDHPAFKDNPLSLVRNVYADPRYDFVWLGTATDGLVRLTMEGSKPLKDFKIDQFRSDLSKPNSITSNFVSAILRLPNGQLWIGTEGGGLCKVINGHQEPEFISFSENQGMSNNVVKSLLFDNKQNLWVATNVGLNKFDIQKEQFRMFRKQDGLPFEDFWYASSRLGNGQLLFSGLDGFLYFDPSEIPDSEALPKLELGSLKILNRTIHPMDTVNGRILLERALSEEKKLVLKHDENVFSVELNSLHYSSPENHYVRHKLLPVEKDWIVNPSSQRLLNYTGLQSGSYELKVAASNSLGEWTQPISLKIVISPPFWKTITAYVIYVLGVLVILYLILYSVLKMQELKHNIQIEQIEKDTEKEVNMAKLRFFANISHELKTPLTLINSPIRILAGRFINNKDVQEELQVVERQSKKIAELIDQVHDFERADANLLKMEYSRFYFDDFIKELIVDFKFLATNDTKELEVIGEDSQVMVSADRDKLEKIFNNLLNNAFKFTKAQDTIKIEFRTEDKDLFIMVSDTGKGIDQKDLPHIFERFYRSENMKNGHVSGSGIGLAFSKRLVEMHYGEINATSELDLGTTIRVRLPIVKPESLADQEDREKAFLSAETEHIPLPQVFEKIDISRIKLTGNFSDRLLFYAEDDSDMRNYVADTLSKFFVVKAFTNGKQCLDAMEEEWPDLVISDVQMPEMNGLELCKRIKSDMKTSHIPVILLTALTNVEDHLQGIRDGADAYISKPFEVRHLVTRVEALLENRKQLRERFRIGIPLTKERNANNRNDNAFLEKLYHLLADNLDNQDLDMDGIARKLYLSRTHFYQKVKALTDKTPFELLKIYRLNKAAELLVENKLNVNEVFVMTGFKSRTHFSKLFKDHYHTTPSKYAAKSGAQHQ
ncbi:response regulator [Arenibacter algicola]|uniref:hybrid sensor histidine kinase/response regulator transcription factor n=1 Tax=Arenibacter algicola TaxID=616991 RepID=UPI001C07C438|nr:hybrid sensor histidine kinase/response regulator transcription factor [Arenibacter algicola]MBU2905330.1 response regulator [Arenibacter algicola]